MSRNRCLSPTANATSIPAIPILTGVKKESVVLLMPSAPPIPDRAISFREMGELIHSYNQAASRQGGPERPPPAVELTEKERTLWAQIERDAEAEYKRTESEYEFLVRDLTAALKTE